ncbi:LacI family transcriptional regulator [Saccharopolyspora sp. K220]|uniref:LacI family DNA-binding transcriptional regulator n=1 Tax=Saccharopolyspora soli TaxID=2926618 RepID=UPI001F5A6B2A|nr:LacI family DNA-binding transcriptional regulator [Saccharopolyspora soli]MCI2422331.1 LacI family transcriptional regulator [Saccharopolyspora soli]
MATLTDGGKPSVTVKTVAARAGVSAQTVSRVLRGSGYVSQQTREKVLAAVKAVGYRPNAVGRSLRATRTPMVGLLITDITNPFYATLHKAIEAVFREHGLTLMLLNSDDDPQTERQQLDLLSSYRPSGLLVAPAVASSLTAEDIAAVGNCVLVSRTLPALDAPSVVTNEPEAMREATEALLRAGHRQIVAVLGPAAASTTERREAGYRAAMAASGHEPLIYYTDQTAAGARSTIKQARHRHPDITAAIGFNTPVTEGILAGLRDQDGHCPDDLSLVGFTDAPWMEFHQPPITVVRQPVEEMGALAAELVLDLIDDKPVAKTAHTVPSRLLHRQSIRSLSR